ncbi:type I restriction endonuclease subunit S, partial [Xanthomonas oryzae pv. oryzae]
MRWTVSELPEGWAKSPVGDLVNVIRGVTFPASSKVHEASEGVVACLRTSHIQQKLLWDNIYFIPKQYVRREEQLTRRNDILMSMANSASLVGKVCINETDEAACFGAFLAAIRCNEVDYKYVYYFLRSSDAQSSLRSTASQTVNIANISVAELEKLKVPLPPLAEQKRIAQKLDALLAQVDTLKARIDAIPALLKRFRQSVLESAFSGELTAEWRQLHPDTKAASITDVRQAWRDHYQRSGRKFVSPNLDPTNLRDDLPPTWQATQIGIVFDVFVGATPARDRTDFWKGSISWVSSAEVAFCRIRSTKEKITEAGYSATSTNLHPSGTVMLAMIGQGKTRGQPAILAIDACHNQNTAALRVHDEYGVPEYLYYYLWGKYEETRRFGGGNNQQALNKKSVQSLPFPLAPLAEQTEIIRRVEQLFAYADQLEAKVAAAQQRIDALTQSLLAKAFRGELVPQDPSDEPAS